MRDNTNIRERLMNIDWFSRIGDTEDIFEGIDYKWIPSVDQIEKYLTSIKWENTCETLFYNYKEEIMKMTPDEMDELWNEELKNYKNTVVEQVMPTVSDLVKKKGLPIEVEENVKSFLIELFLGEYYKEYGETPFFASLLQIYESGHIPVGYTGKIGSGKIIVY